MSDDLRQFVNQSIDFSRLFKQDVGEFYQLSQASKRIADLANPPATKNYVLQRYNDRDAFRHFTWMYTVTANYGVAKARKAGDIHERSGNDFTTLYGIYISQGGRSLSGMTGVVDTKNRPLSPGTYQIEKPHNMDPKDFRDMVASLMDYQNNAIAILAATADQARNFTPKLSAIAALNYMRNYGLVAFYISKDGTMATILTNQKISEAEYQACMQELDKLDDYGNPKQAVNSQPASRQAASTQATKSQEVLAQTLGLLANIRANQQRAMEIQSEYSNDKQHTLTRLPTPELNDALKAPIEKRSHGGFER